MRLSSIYKVQFAKMKEDPTAYFLLIIQPILLSLMFGYFYRGVGRTSMMNNIFLGTGIMAMWQTMLYLGGIIVRHDFQRDQTVSYQMLSHMNVYLIWAHRLLACLVLTLISVILTSFIGFVFFGVAPTLGMIGSLLLGLLLVILSMFSLGMPLIILLFINQHGGKIIQTLAYPISLLSGMIVSVDYFPKIVQIIAYCFPITWSTHIIKEILYTGTFSGLEVIGTIGISVIYMILSFFIYRYVMKHIRKTGEISL